MCPQAPTVSSESTPLIYVMKLIWNPKTRHGACWHLMRQRFCAIQPNCWFPFDFINWHCFRPGFTVWTGAFSSGNLQTSPKFWHSCQPYFSVCSVVTWKEKILSSFLSHIININNLPGFFWIEPGCAWWIQGAFRGHLKGFPLSSMWLRTSLPSCLSNIITGESVLPTAKTF